MDQPSWYVSNCFSGLFFNIRIGNPSFVPRVLEVEPSQLCYIAGTVYMEMPLKPNVMEDVARDVIILHFLLNPNFAETLYSIQSLHLLRLLTTTLQMTKSCSKMNQGGYSSSATA